MNANPHLVRHFRQIVLWPLQLIPLQEDAQIQRHWSALDCAGHPWLEVADEFTGDPGQFQERHYREFITFLPHVQRFLYGEGIGPTGTAASESPIRVFRRTDIAAGRATYPDGATIDFRVAHADLYFFYDIDIVVLVVEICADDLTLDRIEETLYRFGRAYAPFWKEDGSGGHCLKRFEWLAADGSTLAASDYEDRDRYLSFVCKHRSPCIASHWEFLLQPLAPYHSAREGVLRYRQIESHRMPLAAYLALDDPSRLRREDYVRLGLVAPPSMDDLQYSERELVDFEQRYCYDRYWNPGSERPGTRLMNCGHSFVMVGSAREPLFVDIEKGLLSHFRHQYFLVTLIAQFHKAALLMLSDRLVVALNQLDIQDPESVKRFKRAIRRIFEIFLRFTHRYWFHDVTDEAQTREMFRMFAEHLDTDRLYIEVNEEIKDMSNYLDSDSLRRQANTVVRLTVITTFGLIATVTTGFIGMNLIDAADASLAYKTAFFALVGIPVTALVFYAVVKSKKLSDFLEALSDERMSARGKLAALADVWRGRGRIR